VKRLKRIHFNRLKIKWPPNSCRGLGSMWPWLAAPPLWRPF
jgi:hypothetical protein